MQIQTVGIIGAGTMGNGIAQACAVSGVNVVMVDISDAAVQKGLATVAGSLDRLIKKEKITQADKDTALARIQTSTSYDDLKAAQLVIEAATENYELKLKILKQVDGIVGPDVIIASNTSSISITKLAAATSRADKFIGMHFFNPVHIMALLEIVVAKQTSDATLAAAKEAGKRMGKECIVVKDSPGFASSRLGIVLGLEAMRMFEQGVASAEDIDKAMELGYRHPMGPLKLTDLVGLDVRLGIAEYLHRELASEAFNPPKILRDMVAQGKLGKKSGQGFYKW